MATTAKLPAAAAQRIGAVRDKYVKQWSTRAYKMEYGGYLSNHLLHGVVALAQLGASDAHIDAFARRYVEKLCVVDDRARAGAAPAVVREDQARVLLGKRQNFEGLRNMYAAEIQQPSTTAVGAAAEMQRSSADAAVAAHLPRLVDGLAGALLHGIIQLGYAYRAGGDLLVAEGLAYLHFSHLSFAAPEDEHVTLSAEHGKKPLAKEAALALARSMQVNAALLDELHKHQQLPVITDCQQGVLQHRLMCFSSDASRGNKMLFRAVQDAVDAFDVSGVNGHVALDVALWLYNSTPTNDFVLLHATTSAWSLHQVEHLLAADDRLRAWKTWFRMALAAFTMHEVPALPAEDPTDDADKRLATLPDWDELVTRTLALDGDVDEHVYKLVQVAHEVATSVAPTPADEGGAAHSTFLTATQREYVTRAAALKVISSDFVVSVGKNRLEDATV